MKRAFFLAAVGCGLSWGQAADVCTPSVLNVPDAKYPCVYPDHRAMFRVIGPSAQKISVRVGQGFDMTKGPDGVWTVITTPCMLKVGRIRQSSFI